jgi:hypothetical protein
MRSERLSSIVESGCGPHTRRRAAPRAARAQATRALLVTLLVTLASACLGPQSEQLSCDDVLPAGSVDFSSIQSIVLRPPRGKGCQGAPCHSGSAQSGGVRLDEPQLVYEELSTRPELFYAVLASAEMPRRGRPWSDADLRAFRSWYCSGAFPP